MAKVEKREKKERTTVQAKTKDDIAKKATQTYAWWNARSQKELVEQLLSTAQYLRDNQLYRLDKAARHARLYGNMPLTNVFGTPSKIITNSRNTALPIDRPTMNVVQSCVDTLVSRITQARPRPEFITDNGNYKERDLGKKFSHFIDGEFYRLKMHPTGEFVLRDASVLGDGWVKFYRRDDLVACDRVLDIELYEDPNDALYGDPRSRYQIRLMDRSVAQAMFPDAKNIIASAENGFPDNSTQSMNTVSDQILVVEGWHLPSGKDTGDGRHAIVCTDGLIEDREWKRQTFPFARMPYTPQLIGNRSQGLAEQLLGTQVEINRLLITISKSINLVGVPRTFVEKGSKVVKAHFNNEIGSIVEYSGVKPIYEVAPCMPAEVYAQLQRLVDYAYQQSGISALSAASQKPAGLDSGKALREFDDIQSDRFAALDRRYHNFYIDCAYQVMWEAGDIAKETGKYSTVYPSKDGTREIDLKDADFVNDSYVIQCFDTSMLPRDPGARKQSIIEDMQAGLISPDQAKRLLDYPDLEQYQKLEIAAENRILKVLDQIVSDGKFNPPDPFMPLQLATKLTTQYYNLYEASGLEPKRLQMLRDFFVQVQALGQAANPPAPAGPSGAAQMGPAGSPPQAVPQAPPVSPMLPNAPGAA